MMEEEMRHTIDEWGEIFQIQVRDPDGFDRKDPLLMSRTFNLEEFVKGAISSTIMAKKKNRADFLIEVWKLTRK